MQGDPRASTQEIIPDPAPRRGRPALLARFQGAERRWWTVDHGKLRRRTEDEYARKWLGKRELAKRWALEDGKYRPLTPDEFERRRAARQSAGQKARWKRRRKRPVDDLEKDKIAVMSAAGLRDKEIGRAILLDEHTVAKYRREDPQVKAHIEVYRTMFRTEALAKAQAIQTKAWTKIDDSLEAGNAKDFDAFTRGLHAMEKISASASGELRPAQTQVAIINQATLSSDEREELLREFRASVMADQKRIIS